MNKTPRTDAKHKSLEEEHYMMAYGVMLEWARGLELEIQQKAELLATRGELARGERKTKDCWRLIKAAFFMCELEETVKDKTWRVYKDAWKELRAAALALETMENGGSGVSLSLRK